MSELLYSAATVNNLTVDQSAYQIDNGTHQGVIVRVEQIKEEVDLDKDGIIDQINYKTSGAVIDSENNVLSAAGGPAYLIPGKVDSIMASAVAEGTVDLLMAKAQFKDACVHRVVRLKTVLDAI